MNSKTLKKMLLIGPVVGAMLGVGVLVGCSMDADTGVREGGGVEGNESSGSRGEEDSGANLALDETFDTIRAGARLVMSYDAPTNSFIGTVENTTGGTLDRVRIEVHLSNGVELGPTAPVNMAPGEAMKVNIPATPEPFTGWIPHAEVGGGKSGDEGGSSGESSGEHGGGRERWGGG